MLSVLVVKALWKEQEDAIEAMEDAGGRPKRSDWRR